jgi:aspartyl-tRNA(Asn)/glutamyl-tRNA(Gln) amidotransferase subunit A
MDRNELPFLSATALAELLRRREVSPVEATVAYLARIEQVDPALNSYITVTADRAMAEARQAEAEIAAGNYRGPLHGVPVAVKDQFCTDGVLTTGGSSILSEYVPDYDATVMSKLKDAGAVLLGKLNMSEFAMGDAFHHPYGRPRNPWDLSRNPGTSSSGSGAATAAFLCATSLGEDTAGSIRGPAAFCGLVGIRPTWGLVSRYGMLASTWSMDAAGPISRTVRDCAATLGAIAGYDPNDRYTSNAPVPDYLDGLDAGIRGLRVGVLSDRVSADGVEPEVRDAVTRAVGQLGELGAEVEEISIPLVAQSAAISTTLIYVDATAVHRRGLEEYPEKYDHNNRVRLLTGALIPAQAHHKANRLRQMLREQILDALSRVDVLALPASSVQATPIPTEPGLSRNGKEEFLAMLGGRRSYTSPFNVAGVPALSINCGFTSDGLPVGLQLVGRPYDEPTVFRAAYAYEQATDWHTMRPPV